MGFIKMLKGVACLIDPRRSTAPQTGTRDTFRSRTYREGMVPATEPEIVFNQLDRTIQAQNDQDRESITTAPKRAFITQQQLGAGRHPYRLPP